MNYETYAPVLKKAQAALADKNIKKTAICFDSIRVSLLAEKAFWFCSGVIRKLKRRLGK